MVTINIIIIIKIIKKEEVFFLNWMEGAREEGGEDGHGEVFNLG